MKKVFVNFKEESDLIKYMTMAEKCHVGILSIEKTTATKPNCVFGCKIFFKPDTK